MHEWKTTPEVTTEKLRQAFDYCLKKIDENLEAFTYLFPSEASQDLFYYPIENTGWTASFWTGMLWLAYEMTGDEKYRKVAEIQLQNFRRRIDEKISLDTHDLGFLYSLSCVAAYKLTGNDEAKETALAAADVLMKRYREKGAFIQAWGSLTDPDNYRLIIDCLLNLPLLFWASEATGDNRYYTVAETHLKTTLKYIIREDSSTYHTFFFDPETGAPVKGVTHQGFSDTSCWSRGQAWGVYGVPLGYAYTKDKSLLPVYKKLTDYFLSHLPEDGIPYWDLIFTSGSEPRDSSAAAIAICGMLEADKWLDQGDEKKAMYRQAALAMLNTLMDRYTTEGVASNGLLLHAVYHKNGGLGVDECNIWGDYYYMEALVRLLKPWKMYW